MTAAELRRIERTCKRQTAPLRAIIAKRAGTLHGSPGAASAFPQNPANGPTETIGMLACWAADAIGDYVRNPDSLI